MMGEREGERDDDDVSEEPLSVLLLEGWWLASAGGKLALEWTENGRTYTFLVPRVSIS